MRWVKTLVTEISGHRIGREKMTRAELRYTMSNTASHTIKLGSVNRVNFIRIKENWKEGGTGLSREMQFLVLVDQCKILSSVICPCWL